MVNGGHVFIWLIAQGKTDLVSQVKASELIAEATEAAATTASVKADSVGANSMHLFDLV